MTRVFPGKGSQDSGGVIFSSGLFGDMKGKISTIPGDGSDLDGMLKGSCPVLHRPDIRDEPGRLIYDVKAKYT
jgi:hypothetical protein